MSREVQWLDHPTSGELELKLPPRESPSAKPNTSFQLSSTKRLCRVQRLKIGQPKREQERIQTGFEVAQRTTSLHGLRWEHGTVPPATLHEDTTRARQYGHNGLDHRLTVLCRHPYWIRRHIHDSRLRCGRHQRELADPSWSGQLCTHRFINVNRLCHPQQLSHSLLIV